VIAMQDIFVFERRAIDENGKVKGAFRATGIRPKFSERLQTGGFNLRAGLFDSRMEI
jgi:pilus assembly protein CpaF